MPYDESWIPNESWIPKKSLLILGIMMLIIDSLLKMKEELVGTETCIAKGMRLARLL